MKKIALYYLILAPLNLFSTTVEEGICGENVSWSISSDSVLTISGTGTMEDYAARIEVPWYSKYGSNIRKIVVGEGVSHIGTYAFANCSATEVDLHEGLKSIGNYAFRYCHNIQSITLPASTEAIGKFAFDQTNLEAVFLESTTPPEIGTKAFVTTSELNTDIAGTTTNVNDLGFPFFSVPCNNEDTYKQAWPVYAQGVYCSDSIVREYDGAGNYHYILFTANHYQPKGNSLIVSTRTDIDGDNVVVSNEGDYTCNSLTLTDTATFVTPFDFEVDIFNFKRSGTLGSLVSLYLPVEMPTDYINGNVYEFNDFDGEYLNFTSYEGEMLQANYPYVVKPDEEETTLVKTDVHNCKVKVGTGTTVSKGHLKFFGVHKYSSFVSNEKNTFIVFNAGKVKKYNKINLSPFRAAFQLTEPTFATLGFKLDGELTGVALVGNGQLADNPVDVYDIQGHLVRAKASPSTCFEGLSAGIYIVNGQKFIYNATKQTTVKTTNKLKSLSKKGDECIGE